MNTRLLVLVLSIALLSELCVQFPASGVETTDRPNVVFIMTDQQFGDAMSYRMGKEYIHTPAMDSLAENGMVFTRAYAANPLCMPSRNAIFTGRYPHETGVTKNAGAKFDFPDMGSYFKQAGYRTAYIGKQHLCFKVAHSFSTAANDQRDAEKAKLASEFLSGKPKQPFLLVVSFLNPHNVCELARSQRLPDGPIGTSPPPDQCPPLPGNLAPQLDEPDTMTFMRKGYCIYNRGERRESLVDLASDPGETKNLAGSPAHRKTLLEYRALLARFAQEHHDRLAAEILADDVKPVPFSAKQHR